MINTRVLVAFQAAVVLSKAVVIATRSSFTQQQSGDQYVIGLIQMDYKTQQNKLLPLLATVFAFYTTGEYILALNEQATSQFDNNLFDLLPEVCQFIICKYMIFYRLFCNMDTNSIKQASLKAQ